MTREDALRTAAPHLMADLRLYPTSDGGKQRAIDLGFECLCAAAASVPPYGFHAFPLLLEGPLQPGDSRRVGFLFVNSEGAEELERLGRFYLFEGHQRFGEAVVV